MNNHYLQLPGEFEKAINRTGLTFRSKRLDALVAAINKFRENLPDRSRLRAVQDRLDEWKQQDPKEFSDRGASLEASLRHEIGMNFKLLGGREIPVVDPGSHPKWEPDIWNDVGPIQNSTNCYAYACNDPYNHPRKSKPQPGQIAHMPFTSYGDVQHSDVRLRVMGDDIMRGRYQVQRLIPLVRLRGEAVPDHVVNAKGYYLIALVTAPFNDYHWVRQDDNGMWSHKPGHEDATNLDWHKNPIYDPRDATFKVPDHRHGHPVPYKFTTFYYVPKGGVRTGDLGVAWNPNF
jgi:hypothetical protein